MSNSSEKQKNKQFVIYNNKLSFIPFEMNLMVILAEDVKIIDLNSEELGVAVIQLMENAGAAVAQVVSEHFSKAKSIAICCGTGNNGGDGMVAARHLASKDRDIKLILIGQENKIRTNISKQNFKILKQMEDSIEIITINDS